MEPVRPRVEEHVLDLLAERSFPKAEFVKPPSGEVRIRAPLSHELAESMPLMVAWLARMLGPSLMILSVLQFEVEGVDKGRELLTNLWRSRSPFSSSR